jgi:hypothetical protein
MTRTAEYLQGVMAVYQGEVLGEALYSGLLANAAPQHQHYFAAMLQMETEAKARLRPFLVRLGLSVVESEDSRREGIALASTLGLLSWEEFLAAFAREIAVYVDKYQTIADQAPPEDRPALDFMVEHEKSFLRFAAAELTGEPAQAIEALASQLILRLDGKNPRIAF